tara:strand:+ start:293 stop:457 length:165 start_codon:yes stop_codon:yes gene_type:complete
VGESNARKIRGGVLLIFDLLEEMYEDPLEIVATLLQVAIGCVGVALCVIVGAFL